MFLSVMYLSALVLLSYYQYLSTKLLIVFMVINVIGFLLYAVDKYSAKKGYWRIKETTLHFISLIGGWSGAAIAQQWLKHKNRKLTFQIRYWLTIVVNVAVLTTLFYFYHDANHQYF
jgi:uncharacterized membrane protein YsdA (DUF1294 family)